MELQLRSQSADQNLIPENAHVCDDADLAACTEELAGEIDSHGLGSPDRYADIFNDRSPTPTLIFDLKRGQHHALSSLGGRDVVARPRVISPACQEQHHTGTVITGTVDVSPAWMGNAILRLRDTRLVEFMVTWSGRDARGPSKIGPSKNGPSSNGNALGQVHCQCMFISVTTNAIATEIIRILAVHG